MLVSPLLTDDDSARWDLLADGTGRHRTSERQTGKHSWEWSTDESGAEYDYDPNFVRVVASSTTRHQDERLESTYDASAEHVTEYAADGTAAGVVNVQTPADTGKGWYDSTFERTSAHGHFHSAAARTYDWSGSPGSVTNHVTGSFPSHGYDASVDSRGYAFHDEFGDLDRVLPGPFWGTRDYTSNGPFSGPSSVRIDGAGDFPQFVYDPSGGYWGIESGHFWGER